MKNPLVRLPTDEELIAAAGTIATGFVTRSSVDPLSAAQTYFEVLGRLASERARHEEKHAAA